MFYLYYCEQCDLSFEIKKPMAEAGKPECCPQCGSKAGRRYTAIPALFGWRLTDRSQERFGPKNEFERDI